MRASKNGININRSELAALLEFAGDNSTYSCVHFRIDGGAKLIASASDGRRSVECTSEADSDALTGEWRCDRQFVESCRRLVDPNETQVLLKVTEKGMREVLIIGIDDDAERGRYKVPTDAVSTQITIAAIHEQIAASELDQATARSWFAFSPLKMLKAMGTVERATQGAPVTVYAGKTPNELVTFEASGIGGRWAGVFKPSPVLAPGEDSDETEEPAPGTPAPRGLELVAPLATEKKKKAKASKRPAKKAATKRSSKSAPANSTDNLPEAG
jgi:hypothetical protein